MIFIMPKPVFTEEKNGEFVFSDKLYFIIDKKFSNQEFLEFCPVLFKNFTVGKTKLEIVKSDKLVNNAVISLSKDVEITEKITEYEYELVVDNNGISFAYSEDNGLVHGFVSLLQMISSYRRKTNDFTVPFAQIKDRPALELRGMHLCVFHGLSLNIIKKYVILCGLLKCSHILLEFWGSLKYDSLTVLGWSDAYSKEDFKEIIQYGKAFGMEFIPFFNHLGHAPQSRSATGKHTVLSQAPEYEEWFKLGGWTWNIENEDVVNLQKNVRGELCEMFGKGEFFHIGCDEFADHFRLFADNDEDESRVFVNFLNDTCRDIKNTNNRKTMMWGDMFLDKKDFPWPFCGNTNDDFCYGHDGLDDEMYVIDWQYNIKEDKTESVDYFLKFKDPSKLILAPWTTKDGIKGRCNIAKKYKLFGVIGTTWNKVFENPSDMMYTAICMWDDDDKPYKDDYSLNVYTKIMMMNYLRKILPETDYETAGILKTDLFDVKM